MTRAGLFVAGALLSIACHAEDYAVITLGRSHFGNPEKVWHNFGPTTAYGYGSVENEHSNTWALGFGRRFSWGRIEASYQDFGETKSYAIYPPDPGSPALPTGCATYPCGVKPQVVYHIGTAQGINLTAALDYRIGDAAVFVKGGLIGYRATFKYYIADPQNDPNGKVPQAEKWDPTYAIHATYGFGISYRALSLEMTRYPYVMARNSEHGYGNFQRIDTVTLNLRIPIN
jgi:hypothetical protein